MTRDEQLTFCKVCKNQKFDPKIGIICSITDRIADFDEHCKSYDEVEVLKQQLEENMQKNYVILNTASSGKRFANYLIDMVCYWIFTFVFAFFFAIIVSIVAPSLLYLFTEGNKLFNYIIAYIAGMIYYSTFEFIAGRTVAKYITGTKVVDENGNTPSYGRLLLRSVCRFIPFEPFSFLGDNAIGWHDTLSKTRVIDVSKKS
ncbi:MAG: RDD family protein [Bacteroidales bacterium]